jgi:MFS family permease
MTCEAYYDTHPDESAPGFDRCSVRDIEAGTSRAVALLSASTTIFGVLNLFVTGWAINRFGVRTALLISVFWPAVRLAVQNIGVETGGAKGILIVQGSQIITIIGGPAGYLLALNSFVTEVIEHKERTGALGKLQGCTFFGTSSAYLAGGLISDYFGIIAPFRVTIVLFLMSCVYVIVFLPWIAPNKDLAPRSANGISKFFGPLKMFTPQKWMLRSGKIQREYGTLLLGIGVFLGVLATGYQSVLLQMYATDVFGFGTTQNGYLISLNTFIRGLFLTLVFPRVIAVGRIWLGSKDSKPDLSKDSSIPDLPHETNDFAAIEPLDNEEEPIEPPKQSDAQETFAFDLLYVRYSLLADAVLTGAASFVAQGWQMYLIAFLLPLAAGTGSSAKGTILQMCAAGERAEALSAITLVEMVARLMTSELISTAVACLADSALATVFGLVFAALAEVGLTYLVFTCNAVSLTFLLKMGR